MENPLSDDVDSELGVIETFLCDGSSGFRRLDRHLVRLDQTCKHLGIKWHTAELEQALVKVPKDGQYRVRVLILSSGVVEVTHTPFTPQKHAWNLTLSNEKISSDDPWLGFKTTRRKLYDTARADLRQGVDEVIFVNERGEVCEGTITNIFAKIAGKLITPPLICGLLPGVLRQELLDEGKVVEGILSPAELRLASSIYVGNSLRGLMQAKLL